MFISSCHCPHNMREKEEIIKLKPGITKGQHWHNSKWEQFIVVHGHGLI